MPLSRSVASTFFDQVVLLEGTREGVPGHGDQVVLALAVCSTGRFSGSIDVCELDHVVPAIPSSQRFRRVHKHNLLPKMDEEDRRAGHGRGGI